MSPGLDLLVLSGRCVLRLKFSAPLVANRDIGSTKQKRKRAMPKCSGFPFNKPRRNAGLATALAGSTVETGARFVGAEVFGGKDSGLGLHGARLCATTRPARSPRCPASHPRPLPRTGRTVTGVARSYRWSPLVVCIRWTAIPGRVARSLGSPAPTVIHMFPSCILVEPISMSRGCPFSFSCRTQSLPVGTRDQFCRSLAACVAMLRHVMTDKTIPRTALGSYLPPISVAWDCVGAAVDTPAFPPIGLREARRHAYRHHAPEAEQRGRGEQGPLRASALCVAVLVKSTFWVKVAMKMLWSIYRSSARRR
ncbi:hypothetical protein HMN09_00373000 [Mycena chlorophos]|uniref:Uncharacterized protein n=1 Tax=Mycena chlorophos TaxID=658473 RepID=A0A8H6WL13_MYCCL|nr:hypothetical protein HMN09_00373000 [Mycena chlorophos]